MQEHFALQQMSAQVGPMTDSSVFGTEVVRETEGGTPVVACVLPGFLESRRPWQGQGCHAPHDPGPRSSPSNWSRTAKRLGAADTEPEPSAKRLISLRAGRV